MSVAVAASLVGTLVGCGSSGAAAAATRSARRLQTGATVWLCRPGSQPDPCAGNLTATVVSARGPRRVEVARGNGASRFDCFYVYPTVSTELGANADLTVQGSETAVAVAQAERFSQVCRVWAPMYRQRTARSLAQGLGADPHADLVAHDSVLSGWRDYLRHYNDGRPVVFIGHSQGAAMLIRLLAAQLDPNRVLRRRMVIAIILGGNVTVKAGRTLGGSFQHIPVCARPAQPGCVIAYSSFPGEPPANADFGRPGRGVSLQSGQTAVRGMQVACVNPAAIGGGAAELAPYFPSAAETSLAPPAATPWITFPHLYRAVCRERHGASWLQVNAIGLRGDHRPVVSEQLGAAWGFHADDVNLALGNLVGDVAAAERAYAASADG
ncbi:MAG: DUF3089 domain-containing protein [Solirubrobacteraceae bacterium]